MEATEVAVDPNPADAAVEEEVEAEGEEGGRIEVGVQLIGAAGMAATFPPSSSPHPKSSPQLKLVSPSC